MDVNSNYTFLVLLLFFKIGKVRFLYSYYEKNSGTRSN